MRDSDDPWVLAAAVDAGAQILVTGDNELCVADGEVPELRIHILREFIDMFEGKVVEELG